IKPNKKACGRKNSTLSPQAENSSILRSSFIFVLVCPLFFHQLDKVVIKLNFVVIKAVFGVINGDFVVVMFKSVVII
ncbi:hypothetical protein J7E42_23050, partial [Bacillus sp. ISL-37]|nr:hypothetical protein [Bacillus sp. ISL-37]